MLADFKQLLLWQRCVRITAVCVTFQQDAGQTSHNCHKCIIQNICVSPYKCFIRIWISALERLHLTSCNFVFYYFSVSFRWEKAPPSSLLCRRAVQILPAPKGSADAPCLPCSINSRMPMPEPSLIHLAPSYQAALCKNPCLQTATMCWRLTEASPSETWSNADVTPGSHSAPSLY